MLGDSGIQVDARKDGLTFRIDECEGFNGAQSRITEVTRWLSGADVRARLFLSDNNLLLKFPPEQVLPSGIWEVCPDCLSFTPSSFARHSLYNESVFGSQGPLRAMVTVHIAFRENKSANKDYAQTLGGRTTDFYCGFASDDGIDETRSLPEGTDRMLLEAELKQMKSGLSDTMEQLDREGKFETQIRQGNIAAACWIIDTVSREAISVRTNDWAAPGWRYEQEHPVSGPDFPWLRGQADSGEDTDTRTADGPKLEEEERDLVSKSAS